jgi:hypothetical protein
MEALLSGVSSAGLIELVVPNMKKRKAQRRWESRFGRVVLSAADPAWMRDAFGGVFEAAHPRRSISIL